MYVGMYVYVSEPVRLRVVDVSFSAISSDLLTRWVSYVHMLDSELNKMRFKKSFCEAITISSVIEGNDTSVMNK